MENRGKHISENAHCFRVQFSALLCRSVGRLPRVLGDAGDGGKCGTVLEWAAGNNKPVYEILSKIKASFPRRSKMQDLSCTYTRDAK
jgi:hypothetical protein